MNFVVEINETMLVKQYDLLVDSPEDVIVGLREHLQDYCTDNQNVEVSLSKTDQFFVRCVCDYKPRHPYDYCDANLTMDDLAEVAICFIERYAIKKV